MRSCVTFRRLLRAPRHPRGRRQLPQHLLPPCLNDGAGSLTLREPIVVRPTGSRLPSWSPLQRDPHRGQLHLRPALPIWRPTLYHSFANSLLLANVDAASPLFSFDHYVPSYIQSSPLLPVLAGAILILCRGILLLRVQNPAELVHPGRGTPARGPRAVPPARCQLSILAAQISHAPLSRLVPAYAHRPAQLALPPDQLPARLLRRSAQLFQPGRGTTAQRSQAVPPERSRLPILPVMIDVPLLRRPVSACAPRPALPALPPTRPIARAPRSCSCLAMPFQPGRGTPAQRPRAVLPVRSRLPILTVLIARMPRSCPSPAMLFPPGRGPPVRRPQPVLSVWSLLFLPAVLSRRAAGRLCASRQALLARLADRSSA
mmetsp:Transcript_8807/g.33218  ORF Transcript_8807/g.33218 Transcript_8807/m.33218 type:complete len:374 (+) Transcript_8807:7880-9001(+)